MKTTIQVKSSSTNEFYDIAFTIENDLISINCNCRAGLSKTLCKHRLSLIDGDYSAILNKNEAVQLDDIFNNNKSKIIDLFAGLNNIENEIKKLEIQKKKLKKEAGFKLSNGF